MNTLKTGKKPDIQRMEAGRITSIKSTLHLILLGMLSMGFVGYFVMRKTWPGLIFGHMAALGIMGFYGCLAGEIAQKKSYGYWKAFWFAFLIPIIIGVIGAIVSVPSGDRSLLLTCGGWFSLASGIFVVLVYTFIKPRKRDIE